MLASRIIFDLRAQAADPNEERSVNIRFPLYESSSSSRVQVASQIIPMTVLHDGTKT